MVTGEEEAEELLLTVSNGSGCWGRVGGPATPSARMIWVPGVMVGVPGGYIPPRTGLSFFIGSTGLQAGGKVKRSVL
jgi:hypothetical protein